MLVPLHLRIAVGDLHESDAAFKEGGLRIPITVDNDRVEELRRHAAISELGQYQAAEELSAGWGRLPRAMQQQTDVVLARQGRSAEEIAALKAFDVMSRPLLACSRETKVSEAVNPAGTVSTSVTPVAVDGPKFPNGMP